jgi:membrane-associated protein
MTFLMGLHGTVATLLICLLLFADEMGVPLAFAPNELLLVLAGLLIASGGLSPFEFYPVAFATMFAGSFVGYLWARKVPPGQLQRLAQRLHATGPYDHALRRVQGAGCLSLVLARLTPGVRIYTSLVAGAARLDRRSFLGANAIAVALWLGMVMTIGQVAGAPATRVLTSAQSLAVSGGLFVLLGLACYQIARHARRQAVESSAVMLGRLPAGTRLLLAVLSDTGICLAIAVGASRVYRYVSITLPIAVSLPRMSDSAYELALLVLTGGLAYLLLGRSSRRGMTAGERLFAISYRRHGAGRVTMHCAAAGGQRNG